MTVVDGNNVAYGSGAYYEAQIVYTVTNVSDAQARIDWELRGYGSGSLFDSSNSSSSSGGLTSGVSGARTWSQSSGGYVSYGSGSTYVNRVYGSTVTVTQAFSIWGLADGSGGGGTSTANASITIDARPYTAPTTPGTPTVTGVTNNTAVQSWSNPSDWGGNATGDYDAQLSLNSGFTGSPTTVEVLDANTKTWTGLTGNTSHWVRERAKNIAGTSSYTTAASFLTKPSKCTALAAGTITPLSAVITCTAPTGGAASYRLQVSTSATFSTTVYDATGATTSRTVTGLTPGTTYYYRWLATNASGDIGWTDAESFETTSGAFVWDGPTLKASAGYIWLGGPSGGWVPFEVYTRVSSSWVQ